MEKQFQGLSVVISRGVKLGRPRVELPKDFIKEYEKFKSGSYGKISALKFTKLQGIGISTLYEYITIYEDILNP